MNLRLLVFLVLWGVSSITSANWFNGYGAEKKSEISEQETTAYPTVSSLMTSHYYETPHETPRAVYFLPQIPVPKVVLVPSFDVVAREMEQIKQEKYLQEYDLISYF